MNITWQYSHVQVRTESSKVGITNISNGDLSGAEDIFFSITGTTYAFCYENN
jgi:hypothetical protein